MTDPRRLKHDDELGPLLEAADASLSRERMARVQVRVREQISRGTRFAAWKLILALALIAGGAVVWQLLRGAPPSAGISGAMPLDAGLDAPLDAGLDAPVDAPIDAPIDAPTDAPIDASIAAPARPADVRIASAVTRTRDAGVPDAPAAPPDAAVESELPEQIRLYEAARDASRRGEYATALARLDELLVRFPATPLAAEAGLMRADVLARAGKLAEAAAALEALVSDPVHRHRRGELLRTLGDVERRRGDCTRARAAYTRASAERLSHATSRDVAHGLERCAGR